MLSLCYFHQTDCDETLQAQLTAGEFPEGVVWELISDKVIIGGTH